MNEILSKLCRHSYQKIYAYMRHMTKIYYVIAPETKSETLSRVICYHLALFAIFVIWTGVLTALLPWYASGLINGALILIYAVPLSHYLCDFVMDAYDLYNKNKNNNEH